MKVLLINPHEMSVYKGTRFEFKQTQECLPPLNIAVLAGAAVVALRQGRVRWLARDGSVQARWGQSGPGPGEFQFAAGLATHPLGEVLVADRTLWNVQRFTPSGDYLGAMGSDPLRPGRMRRPSSPGRR